MTPGMKIGTAAVTAVGGAALGAAQASGLAVDGSRLIEYVMMGALGLIGFLLRAAWKDLQTRDDKAQQERENIWKMISGLRDRLGALEAQVAILMDRKERGG